MTVLLALLALSQLAVAGGAVDAAHVGFDVATVSTDSAAVSVAGRVVTITAPGAYRLSGSWLAVSTTCSMAGSGCQARQARLCTRRHPSPAAVRVTCW